MADVNSVASEGLQALRMPAERIFPNLIGVLQRDYIFGPVLYLTALQCAKRSFQQHLDAFEEISSGCSCTCLYAIETGLSPLKGSSVGISYTYSKRVQIATAI